MQDKTRQRFAAVRPRAFLSLLMFSASLLFLAGLSVVLHLEESPEASRWIRGSLWLMALLHPLFAVELIFAVVSGHAQWRRRIASWLLPPLRLAARNGNAAVVATRRSTRSRRGVMRMPVTAARGTGAPGGCSSTSAAGTHAESPRPRRTRN